MNRVILVTGGAGYVGSHAAKVLAKAGYKPVVLDNMSHGHEWAVRWGPFEKGDLLDRGFIDAALRKWSPDAVLHFAGLIAVGESVERPDLYYRNNVVGSLVLLESMRANSVKKIVFSSTAAVYGTPDTTPIPETAPRRPANPYGTSKALVETMLADFGAAYGLNSVSLRYFNACGADPDGETGESHSPETHLIPLALEAALGRRGALTVFGTDYPTRDGTCVRDYIHVVDLASAHVRALERTAAAAPGSSEAFNLGTGTGYTVREILAAVERVTGRKVPVNIGPRRTGDTSALVADPARAHRELGWAPVLSDLNTIVGSAWSWAKRKQAEI